MKRIIICTFAALGVLSLFTSAAKSDDTGQAVDIRNRLQIKQYAGAGVFIPKEGDIDIGPSAIYGVTIKDMDANEAAFLDITFSQSGLSDSVLWTRRDVRQTIVRLGYKWRFRDSRRWQYGLDLQSQRMNFGSRKMSALTFGALVEYKLSKRWSAQFESAQKTSKSDVNFGNFNIMCLRYF